MSFWRHLLQYLKALKDEKSKKSIFNKANFLIHSIKNRYPCKLVGEKYLLEKNETVIQYIVTRGKGPYEIAVNALLNDPLLLEKFHPAHAARIGYIAFGDLFFHMLPNDAIEKYKKTLEVYKTK